MAKYKSILTLIEQEKAAMPQVIDGKFQLDRDEEYPVRLLFESMDPISRERFERTYRREKQNESYLKLAQPFRAMKTRLGIDLIVGEKAMELLPDEYTARQPHAEDLTVERPKGVKPRPAPEPAPQPKRRITLEQVLPEEPEPEPEPIGATMTLYDGMHYTPQQIMEGLEALIPSPVFLRRMKEGIRHGMKAILRSETYVPQDTPGVTATGENWYEFLKRELPGSYLRGIAYERREGFISMEEAREVFMRNEDGEAAFDIFRETLQENDHFLVRDRMMRKAEVLRDGKVLIDLVEENASI